MILWLKIIYRGTVGSASSGLVCSQVSYTVLRPAATSLGLGLGTFFAASRMSDESDGTV